MKINFQSVFCLYNVNRVQTHSHTESQRDTNTHTVSRVSSTHTHTHANPRAHTIAIRHILINRSRIFTENKEL